MVTRISTPDVSLAAVIYGLNVLIASLVLSLLMFYVARQRQLVVDVFADMSLKGIYRQRWIAIGLGAPAVMLALWCHLSPLPCISSSLYFSWLYHCLACSGPDVTPHASSARIPA
jgi:hypothetical protein